MPRNPRIILPGYPVHIIQRGNNRSSTFYADNDYLLYLEALQKASLRYDCAVHAYVLMTNHAHLLMTAQTETGISAFMQSVGRRYVRYINHAYRRTGTLWEGRFKSSLIQDDHYYFICSRYIELNPVRAEMASHPGEYRWSSYRHNAMGEVDTLITPHPHYLGLGETPQARTDYYRDLFNMHIDTQTIEAIRGAANKDKILGNDRFKEEIGRMLQRRIDDYPHGGDRKSEKFKQSRTQHE